MSELILESKSHVWLFETPWTAAHQAPPSMGFSISTGVLEWVAIPSPGDLPNPGIKPRSPALQADALPSKPPAKCWTIRVQQTTSAFQASFLREVAASELTETSWLWKKTPRTKFPRTEQTGWPGRVTQGSYHSAWHPGESATGAQCTGLWWLVLKFRTLGAWKRTIPQNFSRALPKQLVLDRLIQVWGGNSLTVLRLECHASTHGKWVRFLVGKLRFLVPYDVARKKKKRKKSKFDKIAPILLNLLRYLIIPFLI